jgi:hypothetical protein
MFLLLFLCQLFFNIICCFSARIDDYLIHVNQTHFSCPLEVTISLLMVFLAVPLTSY